jgi:hypothetical protein
MVTTSVSAARDITEAARLPRAVFVDFPLGHTTGKPGDAEVTIEIVRSALDLTSISEREQLVDLPLRWAQSDDWKDSAFGPKLDPDTGEMLYADDRTERLGSPQFQSADDEAVAVSTHRRRECEVCAGIDY